MTLKTYQEVLQELQNSSNPSHLLLGNGFNASLGVKTSYEAIFERMKEEYPDYKDIEESLKSHDYDIENLIGELKNQIPDKNPDSEFLRRYIERKIKADFMKATYSIVKKQIKGIYQEKNQGIHLLLSNFTNYFTLNYDPLLYLLLMKFGKVSGDTNEAVAFQNATLFQEEDLNQTQNDIYKKIREARKNGSFTINANDNQTSKHLKDSKKSQFSLVVKEHFKKENWAQKDIDKVVDRILKEENQQKVLENINDGFLFEEFRDTTTQNVFFLHGAFHIYKDKKSIKKIKQTQNKAFCEKLEKIIHGEEKDILCVLTGTSEDKRDYIEEDVYLKKCFEKLSTLEGSLVIMGSSLSENDKHIFQEINNSRIDSIYISSSKEKVIKDSQKANNFFDKNDKNIVFFDYKTISYDQ